MSNILNKPMKNYILSIYFGLHDSCLTISDHNRILLHLEAERVFRKKHIGLNKKSMIKLIQIALKHLNISIIDIGTLYLDLNSVNHLKVVTKNNQKDIINLAKNFGHSEEVIFKFAPVLKQKNIKNKKLKLLGKEFEPIFSTHHKNHIGTGLPSKFKDAIIFCADGGSEEGYAKIFLKNNNEISLLKDFGLSVISGQFYGRLTNLVIDKNVWKSNVFYPGKTMGLSAYGSFDQEIYNLIKKYHELFLESSRRRKDNLYKIFKIKKDYKNPWLDKNRVNLAYNAQKYFENSFIETLKNYSKYSDNLIFVGGCALNVLLNSKIIESKLFKNVYLPPIASDCGQSLGAILYNNQDIRCDYPYLGRSFGEIQEYSQTLINQIVDDLLSHKIIGWYQGASEIGPRALGHRSLIGLPDSLEMKEKISVKIKKREPYRPVAPIVLEEDLNKYFVTDAISKYMTLSPQAREITIQQAPAIVHVDGTSRIQTLTKNDNPVLYDVLLELKNRNKPPIIMNTSFNIRGEAIVDTPTDAIKTFKKSKIDVLYINGERFSK